MNKCFPFSVIKRFACLPQLLVKIKTHTFLVYYEFNANRADPKPNIKSNNSYCINNSLVGHKATIKHVIICFVVCNINMPFIGLLFCPFMILLHMVYATRYSMM